jgi:hypothetical protein
VDVCVVYPAKQGTDQMISQNHRHIDKKDSRKALDNKLTGNP